MEWVRKFVGFRVLEWFLAHPFGEVNLNKLARELEISPGGAKEYCDRLEEYCPISEKSMGNLWLFRLTLGGLCRKGDPEGAYHLLRLKNLGVDRIAEGCTPLRSMGALPPEASTSEVYLAILVIGVGGCYIASCPQFKGSHFYGEAVGEGLENMREVALMCLEVARRRAQRDPTMDWITENGTSSPITLQLPQIFCAARPYNFITI